MGLLDEAIRDHLELKRRRGADPGEIAHQERAALDPVFPAEQPLAEEAADSDEDVPAAPAPDAFEEPLADDEQGPAASPAAQSIAGDALPAGEETAELDMQAVLDADGQESGEAPAPLPSNMDIAGEGMRAGGQAQPEGSGGDSFEWEVPGESSEGPAEPGPGQERMSFE